MSTKNLLPFQVNTGSGFTLIELLVTISIIGILIGAVITAAAIVQKNGRDGKRKADLGAIQSALQQFYADKNSFPGASEFNPASAANLSAGSKIYLGTLPKDPQSSNAQYCYSAQKSSGDPDQSCNSTDANCHYYYLYARLEGDSTTPYSCNGQGYNYRVSPAN